MIDLFITWLPLIALLVGVVYFGRYQMRSYGSHVDDVKTINNEIAELNRRNHEIAQEQLKVLKEIKSLLEDRKS